MYGCDKILDKGNIRKEGAVLAHYLRVAVIVGKHEAAGHSLFTVEMMIMLTSLLPLCLVQDPRLPTSRETLPSSVNSGNTLAVPRTVSPR